jgi:hypothetical protein
MVKCKDCSHWDKEFDACDVGPYELDDPICLLKNLLAVVLNNAENPEDGDEWKNNL